MRHGLPPSALLVQGCLHKAHEQGMGPVGAALELRVELNAHKPGVPGFLHDLHQVAVRRQPRQPQPGILELLPELVVEFIPVPVPLGDLGGTVGVPGQGTICQHAGVWR